MRSFIAWWVRNPVAANLLMLGILMGGYLGLKNIEKEAFPGVQSDVIQVELVWPGASPQEVEQQLVQRVEEVLKDVNNVYRVNSTSSEGFGFVEVRTYPNVDLNAFLNDVKGAVDSITSFPRDIENPRVTRQQWRGEMIRVAVMGDIGERPLTRLAQDLRNDLASQPYISQIELFGVRNEEVTIELSEEALRRYDVTFSEVAAAIRANSISVSSGEVRTRTGDIQLRATNLADSQVDFEKIVVRQSAAGGVIHVGDVAKVSDGFEENEILATLNGKPAVLLQVMSTDNMQIVKSSDSVKKWMAKVEPTLPQGVSLDLWQDNADIYNSRMDLITESSLLGLVLVFAVLLLTLRPKVALWVTAGIGVAFLGSFALLPANDVSLNIISTFAFLLVLGIVVDDAIVVGESIHHHTHIGMPGEQAAVEGTMAVSRPVIFAVLTTIVAFAPWLFVSGVDAQVTRQLSIVITLALIVSLIEAFLILPAHLRHIEPRHNLKGISLKQQQFAHWIVDFAERRYRPFLERCVKYRYTTTMVFVAAFIVAVGLFSAGWVKFFFMPQVENEQININVTLPTGTPYERALEVLDQLQTAEKQLIAEVEAAAEASGEGSGQLIEGWYTRSRRDSVLAIVRLAPPEVRDLSAREAAERLSELVGEIPDADEISVNYTLNDGQARVTFRLQHDDLDVLKQASEELQLHLRGYDKAYYVRDNQQGEISELRLSLKPGVEKLGINLGEVSRQVRQAYYGEEVQRLPREFGDVRVMVRYPSDSRADLSSLDDFMIRMADGRSIPLMSVADIELGKGVQRINRRDGERVVTVAATVDPESVGQITKSVDENFLPQLEREFPGLQVLRGGSQEAEAEFFSEIQALYTIALFVMYALIAVAFKSYSLPLLIMTAIPFGFMGAVFGHLLFDMPMALFSYFGIGAAAGVVVNDNLVLVDYIRRREREGLSSPDAVIDAAVNRFRPILLTTVTTFVGLIPIMAERSTSAEFLKPAVLSLAFGVLFALFVSLLMVPALYLIGYDWKCTWARIRGREVEPAIGHYSASTASDQA
ncbi:MAG: efflux RND transporter permease subunit [Halieaceae bacterium]|jgi:multidrug efflux pump subunit AcrB|nr:efflux RND transporter permease subunit [Halieaceae bacterium]